MTMIFLQTEDGKDHHAILNTNQICYMEGFDVTDEWPGGSKTRLSMTGGRIELHTPYKVIADQIAKAIAQRFGGLVDSIGASANSSKPSDLPPDLLKDLAKIPTRYRQ